MASIYQRGKTWYVKYYVPGSKKPKRKSLDTTVKKVAEAKVRKIEDSLDIGDDSPFPTKTPITDILEEFADHLYTDKRKKNADKVLSCLRHLFGEICPSLKIRNNVISQKAVKLKTNRPLPVIEIQYLEQITTADISRVIEARVRNKGIAGKTANRYREIIVRLINWSTSQRGVRMPKGKNPAAAVERFRERKLQIIFLKIEEIKAQLAALAPYPQLQTMVALYILAGLRREEALWLTGDDIDLTSGNYGIIHVRAKTINNKSWNTKTNDDRIVPISKTLRLYLDRYVPLPSDDRWLFPSPEGKFWDPDNFSADLRDINRKLGLSWGCDEYRHTFGSHLAMAGESLFKISKLMGNSEEVCRKHYVHLMPESLFQSVEFMDMAVADNPGNDLVRTNLDLPESERKSDVETERGRLHLRLVVNNG